MAKQSDRKSIFRLSDGEWETFKIAMIHQHVTMQGFMAATVAMLKDYDAEDGGNPIYRPYFDRVLSRARTIAGGDNG
jgi:hypothetical protein